MNGMKQQQSYFDHLTYHEFYLALLWWPDLVVKEANILWENNITNECLVNFLMWSPSWLYLFWEKINCRSPSGLHLYMKYCPGALKFGGSSMRPLLTQRSIKPGVKKLNNIFTAIK